MWRCNLINRIIAEGEPLLIHVYPYKRACVPASAYTSLRVRAYVRGRAGCVSAQGVCVCVCEQFVCARRVCGAGGIAPQIAISDKLRQPTSLIPYSSDTINA